MSSSEYFSQFDHKENLETLNKMIIASKWENWLYDTCIGHESVKNFYPFSLQREVLFSESLTYLANELSESNKSLLKIQTIGVLPQLIFPKNDNIESVLNYIYFARIIFSDKLSILFVNLCNSIDNILPSRDNLNAYNTKILYRFLNAFTELLIYHKLELNLVGLENELFKLNLIENLFGANKLFNTFNLSNDRNINYHGFIIKIALKPSSWLSDSINYLNISSNETNLSYLNKEVIFDSVLKLNYYDIISDEEFIRGLTEIVTIREYKNKFLNVFKEYLTDYPIFLNVLNSSNIDDKISVKFEYKKQTNSYLRLTRMHNKIEFDLNSKVDINNFLQNFDTPITKLQINGKIINEAVTCFDALPN